MVLVKLSYPKCRELRPRDVNVFKKLLDRLFEYGITVDANDTCDPLTYTLIKVSDFLASVEDVTTAVYETDDPVEAIFVRGLLRRLGIHARVKLADKTTRRMLDKYIGSIRTLIDLAVDEF